MPATRLHFRAGLATADITPDPGRARVELSGYVAREQPATGVRDPVTATALAIAAEGQEPMVLVGLDLCMLSAAAAERLVAACPLPDAKVVLACSHTHAAPSMYPLIGCGDPDPAYERHVALRVGDAARRALADMVPARLGWGRRAAPDVRWGNRRDPAGPLDPRVQLLKIERSDSQRAPICAVWSVACHPVALGSDNRQVSADWVGQVRRALGLPSLFLQGFCGDQNPLERGEAALVGWASLAGTVQALWDVTPTAAAGPFGLARRSLDLPRLPGDGTAGLPTEGRNGLALARWAAEIARPDEAIAPTAALIQAWRVGNGRAVFWPGEPHLPLAADLPPDVLAVGHAGASVGYVPERAAYARPGYEAGSAHRYYGFASALAPEAGEALVEASVGLLAELA